MKKITMLAVPLVMMLSLSACGQSDSNQSTHRQAAQSFRVATNGSAVSRFDYQKIVTGNVTSPQSGTSEKELLHSFGKPNSTSHVTVSGSSKKAAVQYTWTNLKKDFNATAMTVEFLDHHAISKGYLPVTSKKRRPVSLLKLKQLKSGSSYQQVVEKLGVPAAESVTGHGEVSAKNVTYATGKDSKAVSLMFSGNRLTTKNQTSLK